MRTRIEWPCIGVIFFPSFHSINRRANGCMDGLTNGRTGNTSFRVICTRHEREINVLHLLPLDSNNSVEYLKKRLQVLRFSEVDGSRRDYDGLKRSRSRKWLYNCEDWSAVGVKTSPISLLRMKEQEWGGRGKGRRGSRRMTMEWISRLMGRFICLCK